MSARRVNYKNNNTYLEFNTREPAITIECAQAGSTFDVPEHHLGVSAGAHDEAILQANGIDGALMTRKRAVQFKGFPVPHTDLCILGASFPPKMKTRFSETKNSKLTSSQSIDRQREGPEHRPGGP